MLPVREETPCSQYRSRHLSKESTLWEIGENLSEMSKHTGCGASVSPVSVVRRWNYAIIELCLNFFNDDAERSQAPC